LNAVAGRRFYYGHGRPQRRRPVEWSLPTDFRAPEAADVTWLPPGATPATPAPDPGPAAEDVPVPDDSGAAEPPEVDKPFSL
jgi:hypothetical protein